MNQPNNKEIIENIQHQENENYLKLIAAQNERNRTVKICTIQSELSREESRRTISAIATGISIASIFATTLLSDVNMDLTQINELVMEAYEQLSSFEALKEYFKSLTPAMYLSIAATILNARNYIRHNRRCQALDDELANETMFEATDFYSKVEGQSRK